MAQPNSPPLLLLHSQTLTSSEEQQKHSKQSPLIPPPPLASLSLSLSTNPLLSKPSPFPSRLKIPSQISSLSRLSFSSPTISSSTRASNLSFASPALLSSPSHFLSRRPSDPSSGAAARRCTIIWLRCDLRIHDNEALVAANNESVSILPVYLFDPRDYGKSSSGFDKTGPYRATFILQSVADLRRSLRARGSDLVVRVGRAESVLLELVRAVGADAVYMHREVTNEEVRVEERVEKVMEREGVEVKGFWGSTLYHVDDLPFEVEQMPSNYGGFREKVEGLSARKSMEAVEKMKGLPSRGDVEVGEIPTLVDLGLNPVASMSLDGKPAVNASLVGGETEALERLKKFAAEYCAQPNKGCKNGAQESIYGANFSCKISPWLAMGCLSPRFMYEELKKTANRAISSKTQKNVDASGDGGLNWLMFELLWRDFFRFITKKYSSQRKVGAEPVTACTSGVTIY